MLEYINYFTATLWVAALGWLFVRALVLRFTRVVGRAGRARPVAARTAFRPHRGAPLLANGVEEERC